MKKLQDFLKRNGRMIFLLAGMLILMLLAENFLLDGETFRSFSTMAKLDGNTVSLQVQETFSQKLVMEHEQIEKAYLTMGTKENDNPALIEFSILDMNGNCLVSETREIPKGLKKKKIDIEIHKNFEGYKGQDLFFEIKNISEKQCAIHLYTVKPGGVLKNSDINVSLKLKYYDLDENKIGTLVRIISVIVFLILSAVLILAVRKKWKVETLFAALYLLVGLLYFIVIPISGVPDELAHMGRVYGITEGDLIATVDENGNSGSMLPYNLLFSWKGNNMKLVDVAETIEDPLTDQREFVAYSNTALYSPFTYVPQCIGVTAGRILSDKIFVIEYIGRFISWLLVGAVLYWSIRILPFGKHVAALIAMIPMNMQENISLAGDSFTTAIVIAFVSYVLYLRYGNGRLKKREYLVMFVLLFFVASCKIVYVPICLLALLVPMQRFPGKKNYFCTVAAAVTMVLVITFGWLAISSRSLMEFREGVDSAEQVKYILTHLGEYVNVIVRTIMISGEDWVKNLFGHSLGWLNIPCNIMIIAMGAVVLIYVAVKEQVDWKMGYQMCPNIMLVSCGIIFLLICTSLYVQWTAVGNEVIEGIQGRYFSPILLPFILGLKRKTETAGTKNMIQPVENVENTFAGAYIVWITMHVLVTVTLFIAFLV